MNQSVKAYITSNRKKTYAGTMLWMQYYCCHYTFKKTGKINFLITMILIFIKRR